MRILNINEDIYDIRVTKEELEFFNIALEHRTHKQISRRKKYTIYTSQNWMCAICGEKIAFDKKHKGNGWAGTELGHIDHIWPKSKKHTYP